MQTQTTMFFDTNKLTHIRALAEPAFLTRDLLVTSPNQGGMFVLRPDHLNQYQLYKVDDRHSSGLWRQDDRLFRSLQHPDHLEIIEYDQYGTEAILVTTDVCDIHDIRFFEGHLVAVSTSTNEIVALSEDGEIKERWQLPGEGDAWHTNCLDVWNGRLVCSAFAQSKQHREWKGKTEGLGIVFDVKTQEVIWHGLNQPHTPRMDEQGNKYICDSANRRVCIDRGDGQIQYLELPEGYTRGLAFTDSHLFVGLSQSRNIDLGQGSQSAAIAVIDRKTLKQVASITLPVIEIYDLLFI
jgi:uncharacterized protein (TIGR03032 family)